MGNQEVDKGIGTLIVDSTNAWGLIISPNRTATLWTFGVMAETGPVEIVERRERDATRFRFQHPQLGGVTITLSEQNEAKLKIGRSSAQLAMRVLRWDPKLIKTLEADDPRHVPVHLYSYGAQIPGVERYLYLRRWTHDVGPNRAYVLEPTNEGSCRVTSSYDVWLENGRPFKRLLINGQPIDYPLRRSTQWGERWLTTVDLARFDIVHDPTTGRLASFTRKRL